MGLNLMGQIQSQAPDLKKDFTAALNIYSRARMLRPSIPHQGKRNRGNLICGTQNMLAKAGTVQTRGRHVQSPAGGTPVSLCTCSTAWCSDVCHAVPPLPHSAPPPPPALLPVSVGTLRCTHAAQQKHSLSSSEAGNPFNTNLPRCKRDKLHLAAALLPSPQCQSVHRMAPTQERVTHCRVTLLFWMDGNTSGCSLLVLLRRPGGLRVGSQHLQTQENTCPIAFLPTLLTTAKLNACLNLSIHHS